MSESEIRLDRYAKFRKLGMYENFLVQGGQYKEAREEREKVTHCLHCSFVNPHRRTAMAKHAVPLPTIEVPNLSIMLSFLTSVCTLK